MKKKDVIQTLKESGWVFERDEAGSQIGIYDLGDRLLQIVPGVSGSPPRVSVTLLPSVTTKEFSEIVSQIGDEEYTPNPIVRWFEQPPNHPELTPDLVRLRAEEVLAWGRGADIEGGLAAYRDLPTSAPGARPLWHLGALALAGDVERLQGYQDSFRRGDRLGFVPYIKEDMIDRALEIAKDERSII